MAMSDAQGCQSEMALIVEQADAGNSRWPLSCRSSVSIFMVFWSAALAVEFSGRVFRCIFGRYAQSIRFLSHAVSKSWGGRGVKEFPEKILEDFPCVRFGFVRISRHA